jgi:hypothetical protein
VVGIEAVPQYLEQAKLVREILGLEMDLRLRAAGASVVRFDGVSTPVASAFS